jgi:hypothetical protein
MQVSIDDMLFLRVVVQGGSESELRLYPRRFRNFPLGTEECSAQHDSYEIPLFYYSSFFVTIQDFLCLPFWSNLMWNDDQPRASWTIVHGWK